MNIPGKRLILGTAVAAAALGVGGIAYATTGDPAPQQGYVTVEEGATTPSPSTPNDGTAGRNGQDCPEKNGAGQGEGEGQGEQAQPSQPDAAENA